MRRSAPWLHSLLATVLFLAACGDDDASAPASVTKLIGPDGGTVELADGPKITIPSGALSETTPIKITRLGLEDVATLPTHMEPAGKPYAFEPHGQLFDEPVKIELPFEGESADDLRDVRPMKLNDADDTQWRTVFPSDKNNADKQLGFDVLSFSVYLAARPRRDSGVIVLPDGAIASDAGMDAGSDAGTDASTSDAGLDANVDVDANVDAALFDSGVDGNVDSDGGFVPRSELIDLLAYIKASNPDVDDQLGEVVAMGNDLIAVGVPNEASGVSGINGNQADNSSARAGAVYVFARIAGQWEQQAYLKASNAQSNDRFGESVALSGETIVVGAPGEDSAATGINGNQADNLGNGNGAVYVFTRSGATWTQQAYIKPLVLDSSDAFGGSVAIDGDTLVVGAIGEDSSAPGDDSDPTNNTASNAGAAYVFVRVDASVWFQEGYLKANHPDSEDRFGENVAISGDTIVVGAPQEDSVTNGVNGDEADNSAFQAGAAYVFTRVDVEWMQQAYLKASNVQADDYFGDSCAISGDTIVIGAPREDSGASGVDGVQTDDLGTGENSGAAYVFNRTGSTWTQDVYLKPSGTSVGDNYGSSVAIWGGTLVVGALYDDSSSTNVGGDYNDNSLSNSGAAYVYVGNMSDWRYFAFLKAGTSDVNDYFGSNVSTYDGYVLVGAFSEDSNATGFDGDEADDSALESGAAYLYQRVD